MRRPFETIPASTRQSPGLTTRTADLLPTQTFWRIRAPSGRILTCAAYNRPKTLILELRVGYDYDDTIVIESAADLVVARQRACQLLETLQDRSGFELVS